MNLSWRPCLMVTILIVLSPNHRSSNAQRYHGLHGGDFQSSQQHSISVDEDGATTKSSKSLGDSSANHWLDQYKKLLNHRTEPTLNNDDSSQPRKLETHSRLAHPLPEWMANLSPSGSEESEPPKTQPTKDNSGWLSGGPASYLSSFMSSFLPTFETNPSSHITKSYANVRQHPTTQSSTLDPLEATGDSQGNEVGQLVKKIEFFQQKSQSFSPFPNDNPPTRNPSFTSLAVSSGYAQVSKQNDRQIKTRRKPSQLKQPPMVASSSASAFPLPVGIMADMHNGFDNISHEADDDRLDKDDNIGLAQGKQGNYENNYTNPPDFNIRKRIGNALATRSSSVIGSSETPDLGLFCREASEKTLDYRGNRKAHLYNQLWDLVHSHDIPVSPRENGPESNQQLILLLEALCGVFAPPEDFEGQVSRMKSWSFDNEIPNSRSRTTPANQGEERTLEEELQHFTRTVPILNEKVSQELDLRKNDEFPFRMQTTKAMDLVTPTPSEPQFPPNALGPKDFVVSGGFSFGSNPPESGLKPGRVESVPLSKKRGGNLILDTFHNMFGHGGAEKKDQIRPRTTTEGNFFGPRQPSKNPFGPNPPGTRDFLVSGGFSFGSDPQNRGFKAGKVEDLPRFPPRGGNKKRRFQRPPRRRRPPPAGERRSSTVRSVIPYPSLKEQNREIFNQRFKDRPPFPRANGPYPPLETRKDKFFRTSQLKSPTPPFTPRSRPRETAPLDNIQVKREFWPPRPNQPREERIPLSQVRVPPFKRPLATLHQLARQRVPTTPGFLAITDFPTTPIPTRDYSQFDHQDARDLSTTESTEDNSVPEERLPFFGQNASSKSSSIVDEQYDSTWGSLKIANSNTNDLQINVDDVDIEQNVANTTATDDVHYVYNVTFFSPTNNPRNVSEDIKSDQGYEYYYEYEDELQAPQLESNLPDEAIIDPYQRTAISTPRPPWTGPQRYGISTSTFAPITTTTTTTTTSTSQPNLLANHRHHVDRDQASKDTNRVDPLPELTFTTRPSVLRGQFQESEIQNRVTLSNQGQEPKQLEIEEVFFYNEDSTHPDSLGHSVLKVDRSKLKGGNVPKDVITGDVALSEATLNKPRSTVPPATTTKATIVTEQTTTTEATTTTTTTTTTIVPEIVDNGLYEYVYEYVDENGDILPPDDQELLPPTPSAETPIGPDPLEEPGDSEIFTTSPQSSMSSTTGLPPPLEESDIDSVEATKDEDDQPDIAQDTPVIEATPGIVPNDLDLNDGDRSEEDKDYEAYYYRDISSLTKDEQKEIGIVKSEEVADLAQNTANTDYETYVYRDINTLSEEEKDTIGVVSAKKVADENKDYDSYFYRDINSLSDDEKSKIGVISPSDSKANDGNIDEFPHESFPSIPNSFQTTSSSLTRNDRFAKDGLPSENDLDSSPAAILRKSQDEESETDLNPEKLAYILIGVCCGLSILCLIVVAISIGYKSETHYRLDDGGRKRHIKLLKASSPSRDEGSSMASSSNNLDEAAEDLSAMKLGPWFTGKHYIQTLDRKANIAFPTSVYLEHLESGTESGTLHSSRSPRDPLKPDEETASGSLSSFDEPTPNAFVNPSQGSPARVPTEGVTSISTSYQKNSSTHSHRTFNVNKMGKRLGSITKSRETSLSQTENGLTTSTGSFRFLVEDEDSVSELSAGQSARHPTLGSESGGEENTNRDMGEIHWSSNADRLI